MKDSRASGTFAGGGNAAEAVQEAAGKAVAGKAGKSGKAAAKAAVGAAKAAVAAAGGGKAVVAPTAQHLLW